MPYQELEDKRTSRRKFINRLLLATVATAATQAVHLLTPCSAYANDSAVYKPGDIVRKVDGANQTVCMTFDDFWGSEEIVRAKLSQLLDLGKRYKTHFTFFPVSTALQKASDLWQKAVENGHEVENHTYTHPYLSQESTEGIHFQLLRHREVANQVLGKSYRQRFLRPPFGDGIFKLDPRIPQVAKEFELIIAMWSADSKGWLYYPRTDQEAISNVVRNSPAFPGNIILQHALVTDIIAAPFILEAGLSQDRQFKTLNEALGNKAA